MVDPYTNGSLFAAILGILISMAAGLMWKNKWALFVSGIVSYVIFRVMLTYVGGWPVDSTLAILYGLGVLVVDIVGYVAYKKLTAPRVPGGLIGGARTSFWTPARTQTAWLMVVVAIAGAVLTGIYMWLGDIGIIALLVLAVGAYYTHQSTATNWKKYIPIGVAILLVVAIAVAPMVYGLFSGPSEKSKEVPAEQKEKKLTTESKPLKKEEKQTIGEGGEIEVTEYGNRSMGKVANKTIYEVVASPDGQTSLVAKGNEAKSAFIMYSCSGPKDACEDLRSRLLSNQSLADLQQLLNK